MEEKNRFSSLLEQLIAAADLKNYTLAQELQYDVSYISKWISGRMLPAEKSSEKVFQGISKCIIDSLTDRSREELYLHYQVNCEDDLKQAIYDDLESAYNYVKGLKKMTGSEVAPITSYFAELTLPHLVSKMKHPVLRRVRSLEVVAAMDLLAMEHEYRLIIAQIENEHLSIRQDFPNVHFSMLINLEMGKQDCVYDAIFLINMLTNFTHIDFQLYGGIQAYGKIVLAVKDAYSISGMLFDRKSCMSVTVSEDTEICNKLYHKVNSLFSRETLLFRKVPIYEMFFRHDYIDSILATNLRWLIGHMTEHLLPDDLFEEILAETHELEKWKVRAVELERIHTLTRSILEESRVHIMIYESAFRNFAVSGELDFYSYKVYLTMDQRLRYMQYVMSLLQEEGRRKIKLIQGSFVMDFQYIANPSVFLSDVISYLRLENENRQNNVQVMNNVSVIELFSRFYEEIWTNRKDVVVEDRETMVKMIRHSMQSISLLSRTE